MILTVTLNPAFDHILWISKLTPGRINRAKSTERLSGGKGVNVANVLATLGDEVIATGFLGGQMCRVFENPLLKSGVTTSFVYTDQEIRTDFYAIEEGNPEQTMVIEDGVPIKQRFINNFAQNYDRLLALCDTVVIGGSLPIGIEPKFVKELVVKAKAKNKKVVLDLLEPILTECLSVQGLFIIKPDVREKKVLFGKNLGDEKIRIEIAKDLIKKGAEVAILNYSKLNYLVMGKNGEAYEGGIECEKSGILIGVQDGMLAGFLHNYLSLGSLEEAFKFALASGLATERSETQYPESQKEIQKVCSLSKVRRIL